MIDVGLCGPLYCRPIFFFLFSGEAVAAWTTGVLQARSSTTALPLAIGARPEGERFFFFLLLVAVAATAGFFQGQLSAPLFQKSPRVATLRGLQAGSLAGLPAFLPAG